MKKALSVLITAVMMLSLFVLPMAAAVTKVELTIDSPTVGSALASTAAVPASSNLKVAAVSWSPNHPVAKAGVDYTVTIQVKMDSRSSFFGAVSTLKVTINGKKATVISGSSDTITVKYTWESDGSPLTQLKEQLPKLAASFVASNGTTDRDVKNYLKEKLPGAEIWSTGSYSYRRNLATETTDGFLNVDLGITYNGATIENFTFSAVIPALNKSAEATNFLADKALMQAAAQRFAMNAKTKGADLLAAINAAAVHGTRAAWGSDYEYTAPTATREGSIFGYVNLTLGNQKDKFLVSRSIPVDGSALDAAIDADEEAIRIALRGTEPSNSTSQDELLKIAKSAIKNGSTLKLTSFLRDVATFYEEGQINIFFTLELDSAKRSFSVRLDIPKLRSDLPTDISVTSNEWEVLRLVNIERNKAGLNPLSMLGLLQDATDLRANEILEVYTHDRPDGSDCFTAISDSAFKKNRPLGENIALNHSTPDEAMAAWMNSSGHKANILHAEYTYIGCGVAGTSKYKGWVQQFAGGGLIPTCYTSTGSNYFASEADIEKAYLICESEGYKSYMPLETDCMIKNGNQYTLYIKGSSITLTVGEAPAGTQSGGNTTPAPTPTIPAVGTAFTDIPAGAYYADAVAWAVANGITTGTSETTFSPNEVCTRAQVITFLWRSQGKPEPKGSVNPFTDVKTTDYFYKAVLWAIENRITNGTSDTTFSPDDSCSGGQVITFLYRTNNPLAYKEMATPYYANAVNWAASRNILAGTASTFNPDLSASRSATLYYLYASRK